MSKFAIAALLIITFCTMNALSAAQPASAQSDADTAGLKSASVASPASGELSSSRIRGPGASSSWASGWRRPGSLGHDNAEKLCERNARTQITYWGPDDAKTELHEYAHKEWSGLSLDFYLPRWEMFVAALRESMNGKPLVEPDYFAFEKKWTEEYEAYPAAPSGDPVDEAAEALGYPEPKTSTTQGTEFHKAKTQRISAGNLRIAKP